MKKKKLFLILLLLPLKLSAQSSSISPSEALKTIFSSSQEIVSEKKTLDAAAKGRFKKELGYAPPKDQWSFFIARSGSTIDGYALIDNQVGKTEPITFLTAISPNGEVKAVEILAYRESIGGEVKDKRFLKQYERKKKTDPVRTGQDIQNITGATLSARAVSVGVKRGLILWNLFYGKH